MYSVSANGDDIIQDHFYGSPVCNLTGTNEITYIPSSLNQLPQDLCDCYGYVGSLEVLHEAYNNDFLQVYAVKCGYRLTEDFLLIMNKYKTSFMDKVDSILTVLSGSFSFFLKGLGGNKSLRYLMYKTSSYFSKYVCVLRPRCICVLQHDIIPVAIKSIFNCKVIDDGYEREMTYPEMERLFLHFVAVLEKSIVAKIMKYWRNFCDENRYILSAITDVDYSNPFVCEYGFNRVGDHGVAHLAAFSNKFGEYVSFIAIAKINEIMGDFICECNYALEKLVSYKFRCICNFSDGIYDDLEELRDGFKVLIEEEFDKMVEGGVKGRIGDFLKSTVILGKHDLVEKDGVLIFDNVIEAMRNLLMYKSTNNLHKIIKYFKKRKVLSKKRSLVCRKFLPIEDRWGIRIHPEDDCNILSIRRKFFSESRKVIEDKFFSIIKEGHIFLNSSVDWGENLTELLPVAEGSIKRLIDSESEEISKFLSSVRVIDDVCAFDGLSAGVRKATSEETDNILKIYTCHLSRINSKLFNRIWKKLINKYSSDIRYSCEESSKCISGSGGEVISGIKLRYSDNVAIMMFRKKFSSKIETILYDKFIDMFNSNYRFSDGRGIDEIDWSKISTRMLPVAADEVGPIIENEIEELEAVLSRSLVVVDSFSRGLTDKEVSIILENSAITYEKLKILCGRIWDKVIISSRRIGGRLRFDDASTTIVGARGCVSTYFL